MTHRLHLLVMASLVTMVSAGCGGSGNETTSAPEATPSIPSRAAPAQAPPEAKAEADHSHDETPLGTVVIGDLEVTLAQGHGAVVAGKEGHLVVKLPYSDGGSTIVRAWIGTKDRTLSYVGKGEYAASHDDYDIHATAPDPLPFDAMWWIEVQKPDGTKIVGSGKPILE
jgi:hypothetical protein